MQEINSRIVLGFLLVAAIGIVALLHYRFLWPVVLFILLGNLAVMVRKQ